MYHLTKSYCSIFSYSSFHYIGHTMKVHQPKKTEDYLFKTYPKTKFQTTISPKLADSDYLISMNILVPNNDYLDSDLMFNIYVFLCCSSSHPKFLKLQEGRTMIDSCHLCFIALASGKYSQGRRIKA